MQILEEILEKTDGRICKHCLGRMLSKTIEGEDNFSRAESLNIELNENENMDIRGAPPEFWSLLLSAYPPESTHMVTD